jgi:hypothetical protein
VARSRSWWVVVVVWAVPDFGNACQGLLIVRTICHNSAEQKEVEEKITITAYLNLWQLP